MEKEKREIRISREFDAPRAIVFDAFTAPEKIGRWWGPNGFSTTTKKMKFEIGGDWIFTMHGPDGTDYPNHIVYTEIIRPERIQYDHYDHKDSDEVPHFKATINFEDKGGRTEVQMKMLFPTAAAKEDAAQFGAVEGGHQTLARLAEFLANNQSTNNS